MIKPGIKYFLQLIFMIILYTVLSNVVSDLVLVLITVVIVIIFMAYNIFYKWSGESKLEVACNPKSYLEYIERRYRKYGDFYHLYKAYGSIYNGDVEVAREALANFKDLDALDERSVYIIYNKVKAQLLFHDKNVDLLVDLIQEIELSEFKTEMFMNYLNTLLLLLREDYKTLVELLFEIIPKQTKRFHIIELEYYLALAYEGLDKKDDVNAVTEFVIKKGHPIIYTKKCRDLHDKMNKE